MLHNVFKKKSQATTNDKENPKNPRTKLQGYHEIVKVILIQQLINNNHQII